MEQLNYRIPLVKDTNLTYSDKIALGFILLLSDNGKNKTVFFSKEILEEMQIPMNSMRTVLNRLENSGYISVKVEQNYLYKQRIITITDKSRQLLDNLNNSIKTLTETKKTKNGTTTPHSTSKSILVNSDSDMRVLFDSILDEITKEGKTIPLAYNVGADVTAFTRYYMNKNIYRKTARKWIDNSLKAYRNTESVPQEQIKPHNESITDFIEFPEDHENE